MSAIKYKIAYKQTLLFAAAVILCVFAAAGFAETDPNKSEPNKPQPAAELPKEKTAEIKPAQKVLFHGKCENILKTFVDGKGRVNYSGLQRQRQDLDLLLNEFARLEPNTYNSWPKEDKMAFWINAYNIQMINVIALNYPIKTTRLGNIFFGPYSIRNIRGIWSEYKSIVMDEEFTLSEIDRRFFRSDFNEPKAFFALSQASASGPALHNEPYSGCNLHQQLDEQVRKFLNRPDSFRINKEKRIVYLSGILQSTWFGGSFIGKYGTDKKFKDKEPAVRAVLNFICGYMPEQDKAFLEIENYTVEFITYDWSINNQAVKG